MLRTFLHDGLCSSVSVICGMPSRSLRTQENGSAEYASMMNAADNSSLFDKISVSKLSKGSQPNCLEFLPYDLFETSLVESLLHLTLLALYLVRPAKRRETDKPLP